MNYLDINDKALTTKIQNLSVIIAQIQNLD